MRHVPDSRADTTAETTSSIITAVRVITISNTTTVSTITPARTITRDVMKTYRAVRADVPDRTDTTDITDMLRTAAVITRMFSTAAGTTKITDQITI